MATARRPALSSRLAGFGTTIFHEMTTLAQRTGAINLGQGFPDTDGPPAVIEAAVAALRAGHNQYPPGDGIPSLRGLCEAGDEVIALEPYYDSYAACAAMADATLRPVTLRPPDFRLDPAELAAAVTPRTRLILLNTPHNPTGAVLDRDELEAIAAVCREHDLLAVTDEVYEHLVYDGEHVPLATLPGMAERTLTISSGGKSFSFTGWKVGWACGPA